jgi:RND family efflux transporter MFP subunit
LAVAPVDNPAHRKNIGFARAIRRAAFGGMMNRRRKIWLALGGVLLLAAGGAVALKGGKPKDSSAKGKEPPVLEFVAADLVQLATRPLAVELALPGSVQAMSQATVRSKLSAEVRQVHVREGERVRSGQVLVEFDTAALRVQLAERSATLDSAKAQLVQTDRTRQVNAQLVKQNFISQNAFDTADSAYRAQAAAVEAAEAQLAQTQLLLNDAVVRAPIAGHVSKRYVQPGEKVGFDAPLVGIVDLGQLEVQAQAPVSDVAQIAPGARAAVTIEGLPDRTFEGRVERINPSTEPGTRSINFYVSISNEEALLRAGMFAKVRLHVGADKPVPALPISAVRNDNGQDVVWVLADGKLRKQAVTVGRRDERAQMVEIRGGLSGSEQVIATRFDNLRDGLAAKAISSAGEARMAGKDVPRVPARVN